MKTSQKLIPDFYLMDIGNDVVFSSRSCLVTVDGLGRESIVIKDGAMLGDRSVGLPGVKHWNAHDGGFGCIAAAEWLLSR